MCLHNYGYICDGKRKNVYRFSKYKMPVECVLCGWFPSYKTNILNYEGEVVKEGVSEHCDLVLCHHAQLVQLNGTLLRDLAFYSHGGLWKLSHTIIRAVATFHNSLPFSFPSLLNGRALCMIIVLSIMASTQSTFSSHSESLGLNFNMKAYASRYTQWFESLK